MSDLSSFYGGRRGFSFNLVKRFDGYDIPEGTYCKSYYATTDGINFIITTDSSIGNVPIDDSGHYLIKRNRYNYLDINKWVLQNDDGSAIPGNINYNFPIRYAEGLVQCFEQGVNSLNEVGYGEYVIIDSVANLDNYDDPDNGKLYRRGQGLDGIYDAEYICQISGPQGGTLVNTIINRDGTELPKEKFIKLEGALYAEDDASHDRTKLFVDAPTPESIGFGIGVSNNEASTGSRTAVLQDYNLIKNGAVAIRFTTSVVANATLNINNKGAKPIYYKNAALINNVIKTGDTITFFYDGEKYHIVSIDRSEGHVIQNKEGIVFDSRSNLQFTGNVVVTDDDTHDKTKVEIKGDEITNITWEDYIALTPEEREGKHYLITGAPQGDSFIQIFNLSAQNWENNTDTSTEVDYPYIYEISTTLYSDTSVPIWDLLGATSDLPTGAERDVINTILEAVFTSTKITLYANEQPTVNLRLRVKGR